METTLTPNTSYARELLATAENSVTSGINNPEQWLIDAIGGSRSTSGARVSVDTVLGLPAAWRSLELIATKLASMPAEVQRRQADGGYEPIFNHPVERLLNRHSYGIYTPFTLRQTMMVHALLEGNGRAYILRDEAGNPESLTLMMPKQTYCIVIDGDKYHVVFFTRDQYGDVLTPQVEAAMRLYGQVPIATGNGSFFTIPDSDVLHIPGLSYNGIWGIPLVAAARNVFGVDQSGHDAIAYQFNNGGRPGLLLTAPRGLFPTDKQAREFMAQFRAKHEGVENAGKTGMLREGMTAETVASENTFSGLTDLWAASKSDIALLFGTEYLMGEVSAVYKDLQSRMTAFYQNTLDRWAEVWEQEGGRKLLNRQRYLAGSLRLHLDPTAILRGTPNELAEYTGKLRTQGLISGNEGRKYHNLSPVDGLDDDFGNPAITPGEFNQPTEIERETDTDLQAENRGKRAVQRHFALMCQFERRRLIECAATDSGFCDRVNAFYDGFQEKLTELCDDLLIDPVAAADHCEESKRTIFELAGVVVGQQQLQDSLQSLTQSWDRRYAKFANF